VIWKALVERKKRVKDVDNMKMHGHVPDELKGRPRLDKFVRHLKGYEHGFRR